MNVRLLSPLLGLLGPQSPLRRGAALLVLLLAALTACNPNKLESLTVSAQTTAVPSGTVTQLSATGLFASGKSGDITSLVTWTSAQPSIAGVSARGVADGKAQGKATVTAAYDGLTATIELTVGAPDLASIEVVPPVAVLANGLSQPFTAKANFTDGTSKDITSAATWAVEGTVATLAMDPVAAKGAMVGRGKVTIGYQNKAASAVLVVTDAVLSSLALQPESPSLARGTTLPVRVIGTYSDGMTRDVTSMVAWTSEDAATAAIADGQLQGKAVGATKVTAALGTVKADGTCTVTAATLSSVALTPAHPVLPSGSSVTFTATGTFSDGSTQDLTAQAQWQSSAGAIAAVQAGTAGLVKAVDLGQTTITATVLGKSGTAVLSVTPAALTGIDISPKNPTVAALATQAFIATGSYTDGSTVDLSSAVTWASADAAVATISNVAGSRGVATAVAPGSAAISASFSGVSAQTTITVPVLAAGTMTLTPRSSTVIRVGFTAATGGAGGYSYHAYFKASGAFSAGTADVIRQEATQDGPVMPRADLDIDQLTMGQDYGIAIIVTDSASAEAIYGPGVQQTANYKQLFVAGGGKLSGNLGGIAGADATCQAGRPAGVASAKAVLSDGNSRVACTSANCSGGGASENKDWALSPNTPYATTGGASVGVTNSAGIFTFPLQGPTVQSLWISGFETDWTSASASWLCNGWTMAMGPNNMHVGNAGRTDTSFLYFGNTGCWLALWNILCAEQ